MPYVFVRWGDSFGIFLNRLSESGKLARNIMSIKKKKIIQKKFPTKQRMENLGNLVILSPFL